MSEIHTTIELSTNKQTNKQIEGSKGEEDARSGSSGYGSCTVAFSGSG